MNNMRVILICLPVLILKCLVNCSKDVGFFFTTQKSDVITVHNSLQQNIEDKWIAKALYKNDINNTGFAYLEIETNGNVDSINQALNAGYIEGYLTSDLILSHWINTVDDFCKTKGKEVCPEIMDFIKTNTKWVRNKMEIYRGQAYWDQISLYYIQFDGMFQGMIDRNPNTMYEDKEITWYDIFWMNVFYDVRDLYEVFKRKRLVSSGSCSVLIKILPGFQDIYIGHNTWQNYQHMLKMQKKYILRYTKTISPGDDLLIPGFEMTFTSYPGTISSQDDFYLISSGLAATETTNKIYNKNVWKYIKPVNAVFENVRSMVANRLATDGKSWNEIFKQYNSGTYNNQWIIIDYNKFKPGGKRVEGLLWVSEQMPTKFIAKDQTDFLVIKGYWFSYNIPYYKEIYEFSGYNNEMARIGTWFSQKDAPRAKIFSRDQTQVVDMTSFFRLMRSNNFKKDKYAYCNCTPPYSGSGAIAARDDLNIPTGRYQFEAQQQRPHGATDVKITNFQLFRKLQFIAVAGPTAGTDNVFGPFKWSTSDFNRTPHLQQPDVWDFKPVLHKWSLPVS